MSSFSALLGSISQEKQKQQNQSLALRPPGANPAVEKPQQPQANGVRPAVLNGAPRPAAPVAGASAPLKRKAEDQVDQPRAKTPKTDPKAGISRPPPPKQTPSSSNVKPSAPSLAIAKPAAPNTAANVPYRGTARPGLPSNPTNTAPKQVPKPATSAIPPPPTANGVAKKKGFAATLAKAQAAQEAAKSAGASTIVHKPAEKLTKRDRERLRQEALEKEKAAAKNGKLKAPGTGVVDRSRSGTPVDGKKKAAPIGYAGTMKKPPEKLNYGGTMRAAQPGEKRAQPSNAKRKDLGQDKYGGYASWSDLDAAEDEEEGGYDESDLSDMEGGFDDVEEEEQLALRAARKEDQAALAEEERLKREKLERKKKLMALSKGAAAKKKY